MCVTDYETLHKLAQNRERRETRERQWVALENIEMNRKEIVSDGVNCVQ
jgi:hypothetical protein